jgi:hypothetical protein
MIAFEVQMKTKYQDTSSWLCFEMTQKFFYVLLFSQCEL